MKSGRVVVELRWGKCMACTEGTTGDGMWILQRYVCACMSLVYCVL